MHDRAHMHTASGYMFAASCATCLGSSYISVPYVKHGTSCEVISKSTPQIALERKDVTPPSFWARELAGIFMHAVLACSTAHVTFMNTIRTNVRSFSLHIDAIFGVDLMSVMITAATTLQ